MTSFPDFLHDPLQDPVLARQRADLEHDRGVLERLCDTVGLELLPAATADHAPGWRGPARRGFDLRLQLLDGRLRSALAGLDEAKAALAAALATLGGPS